MAGTVRTVIAVDWVPWLDKQTLLVRARQCANKKLKVQTCHMKKHSVSLTGDMYICS